MRRLRSGWKLCRGQLCRGPIGFASVTKLTKRGARSARAPRFLFPDWQSLVRGNILSRRQGPARYCATSHAVALATLMNVIASRGQPRFPGDFSINVGRSQRGKQHAIPVAETVRTGNGTANQGRESAWGITAPAPQKDARVTSQFSRNLSRPALRHGNGTGDVS